MAGRVRFTSTAAVVVLRLVDHVEVFHLVLLVQKQIVLGSQLRHRRRHACC